MIRSILYDFFIGNNFGIASWELYEKFLITIPDYSKILDVGVGTGLHFEKCAKIIKEKNLTIYGQDIDKEYIKVAEQRIRTAGLENCFVTSDQISPYSLVNFNYCIFIESYPVIDAVILKEIINKTKNYCDKFVFIHNISEENRFMEFIKPKLKYIPLFWIDFGRLVTMEEFDNFCKRENLKIIKSQMLIEKFGMKMYIFITRPPK